MASLPLLTAEEAEAQGGLKPCTKFSGSMSAVRAQPGPLHSQPAVLAMGPQDVPYFHDGYFERAGTHHTFVFCDCGGTREVGLAAEQA